MGWMWVAPAASWPGPYLNPDLPEVKPRTLRCISILWETPPASGWARWGGKLSEPGAEAAQPQAPRGGVPPPSPLSHLPGPPQSLGTTSRHQTETSTGAGSSLHAGQSQDKTTWKPHAGAEAATGRPVPAVVVPGEGGHWQPLPPSPPGRGAGGASGSGLGFPTREQPWEAGRRKRTCPLFPAFPLVPACSGFFFSLP